MKIGRPKAKGRKQYRAANVHGTKAHGSALAKYYDIFAAAAFSCGGMTPRHGLSH